MVYVVIIGSVSVVMLVASAGTRTVRRSRKRRGPRASRKGEARSHHSAEHRDGLPCRVRRPRIWWPCSTPDGRKA